ncbi:Crp/Fnr family transcriptional regulator [Tissierella carlieri]|uniref:Crp/Fnr family transcriptional regulator n=1 Tax=Tissierella carlieri TaxID=689904 RepID=A0ABT1S741_9FIRM|nr:Crp/Fnr family transcriptional regulator [Tissierella carlieri]MCQ4922155.1 Crp/Fnr family transcriptional regulator [Tissierella carlieri]
MRFPQYYFENHFSKFESLLRSLGEECNLKKGYEITSINPNLYLYFTLNGIFKLSLTHEEGAIKTICFHGKNSILPYSLCRPTDNEYKIESDALVLTAITDVLAIRIIPRVFHKAMLENPDFHMAMTDYCIRHSNLFMFESINLSYNTAFIKTCNFLYIYTSYLQGKGIRLTQSEIGEIIGETRLEVARVLKKLRTMGIVSTSRNGIEVLDMDNLINLCSYGCN